jgi:hypothetical protein
MRICVLGASGKSGRRIVRAALRQGHSVTAIVRNAAKIADLRHEQLTERVVPFTDEAALADAIRGHDAAVNAAGYVTEGRAYVELVQRVIRATQSALGADGRFWLFGGAALLQVPDTGITTLDLPGVPKLFEAHRSNYDAVRATSLDWSMLCPGPMIDAPDGKPTAGLVLADEFWPVARPAYTRFLPRLALSLAFKSAVPRMTIYYEDAAEVIVSHLGKGGPHSRRRVGIALPNAERREKREAVPDSGAPGSQGG